MTRAAPPGRAPDASMTLLTTMLQRPLDPGYAAAADRREAQGRPRSTSLRSPLLVVATVLIGLVVGVASYNLTTANEPRSKPLHSYATTPTTYSPTNSAGRP
jgi:hypothetical protein